MRSQALAGLLRRIEQTAGIASGRFPMFADPRSGEWTWSDDGAWSGACIDGLPGAVPLLAFAAARTGDDRLRDIALAHARGLLALCMRADGSVAQSATYDHQGRLSGQASIEGSSRDSTWARAQAWAMLGLAQAAHLAAGELTQPAKRAADWYLDHLPADGVCFWDFDDPAIPNAPRDTSAAAIAAAALLKLAAAKGIWGDYFLLEALLALDGVIRPGTL